MGRTIGESDLAVDLARLRRSLEAELVDERHALTLLIRQLEKSLPMIEREVYTMKHAFTKHADPLGWGEP